MERDNLTEKQNKADDANEPIQISKLEGGIEGIKTSISEDRIDNFTQRQILNHGALVNAVEFLHRDILVSGGQDGEAVLWDLPNKSGFSLVHKHTTTGSNVPVIDVACAKGKILAVATREAGLFLWDVKESKKADLIKFDDANDPTKLIGSECVVFSADGNVMAVAYSDLKVHVWAVDAGSLRWTFKIMFSIPAFRITSLALSRDGRFLAVGVQSNNNPVFLVDVETGKSLSVPIGGTAPCAALDISDQNTLAVGIATSVNIIDISQGVTMASFSFRESVRDVVFQLNLADTFAVATSDAGQGTVELRSVITGLPGKGFKVRGPSSIAFTGGIIFTEAIAFSDGDIVKIERLAG